MKHRLSSVITAAIVAVLSPLPGCSDNPEDNGAGGAGGTGAGSTTTSGVTSSTAGSSGSGGTDPTGSTSTSSSGGGDGGSTGSGDELPATLETLKQVIDLAPCAGAECHNGGMNPLQLPLDDDDKLYTNLTTRISVACGNIPVVNPGKPEESALIKILKGPCGQTLRMPVGCVEDTDPNCVPPSYMEAITKWIADGAQR